MFWDAVEDQLLDPQGLDQRGLATSISETLDFPYSNITRQKADNSLPPLFFYLFLCCNASAEGDVRRDLDRPQ